MGLFSSIKSWKPFSSDRVAAGTSIEIPVGGALGMLLGGSRVTDFQAFQFYRECQAVATVIDLIAEPLADLPLFIEIDGKTVSEHEILDFLNAPHPDYTGRLFKTTLATHFLLTGNGYVWAGGNFRYEPSAIAPISPRNVGVMQAGDGFASQFDVSGMMYPGQYKRNKWLGRRVFLANPVSQIKQIRRFSTEDNGQLRGESKLAAAAMDVRQNLAGGRHNFKTLTKGGRLTLLFSIKDEMTTTKFQEAKQQLIAQYSGDNGAGIGVVNAHQIDVQEMGINNKDMDFANLQSMTEKAVAKRYNVPMALVSDASSTYNNLSTAYQALYDNAIIPNANQIFDGLGDLLFPRFKLDPKKTRFKVDVTSVPAIAERMADIAIKRRQSGTWKDNELRAEQGLDPVKDGDVIYRPANLLGGMANGGGSKPRVMGDEE